MPDIPENWKTLNVRDYFSRRGGFPSNLRITRVQVRGKLSSKIYAQWLPSIEEDARENQGRGSNPKGKRLVIQESMDTDDPLEASKRAIKWIQRKQEELRSLKEKDSGKPSLMDYWKTYFERSCKVREKQRNFQRWKREELLKWNADEYGISNQRWARRNVDLISRNDFEDYFALLEKRSRIANGSNGSGMKGQQKTLIRKLLVEAEKDFVGHRFPSFPPITKVKKQVPHLKIEEWKLLLRTVFELGEGKEAKARTSTQYNSLDFNPNNRQCVRNWVDLYDAMQLEWFFYLRAEDMCRLKSEWFSRRDTGSWTCFLETTKKDRQLHQTSHYRRDADSYLKRILGRKPNGYLVLPHMNRPDGNEAESGVLKSLNFLLKKAFAKCLPEFPIESAKWTTIRHTAFRLTLEDMPELGLPPDINAFADNGHTSPQMLRETYLRYIDAEKTASRARKTIEPTPNVRFGGKYKSTKDIEEQEEKRILDQEV